MKLIDTHTHLNFEAFRKDFAEVIQRSFAEGILKVIVVGTNLETSERAVEVAESYPNVYASVGIHPYHSLSTKEGFRDELEILTESEKVVAIGEIGLDFFRIKDHNEKTISETKEKQLEILRGQLGLAVRLDLPVIIHNRKADESLIDEIQRYKDTGRLRGVFHCFDSPWDFAQKILKSGFYVSFTGIITYANKQNVKEVARKIPDDKYMLETDSPYLTPEPKRNERNEPKNVKIIAREIGQLKNTSIENIAKQTTTNAENLFKRIY